MTFILNNYYIIRAKYYIRPPISNHQFLGQLIAVSEIRHLTSINTWAG